MEFTNRVSNKLRRAHSGIQNLSPILVVVATIDGSPGEIYYNFRAVKAANPWTQPLTIPRNNVPRRRESSPSQDGHVVA